MTGFRAAMASTISIMHGPSIGINLSIVDLHDWQKVASYCGKADQLIAIIQQRQ